MYFAGWQLNEFSFMNVMAYNILVNFFSSAGKNTKSQLTLLTLS